MICGQTALLLSDKYSPYYYTHNLYYWSHVLWFDIKCNINLFLNEFYYISNLKPPIHYDLAQGLCCKFHHSVSLCVFYRKAFSTVAPSLWDYLSGQLHFDSLCWSSKTKPKGFWGLSAAFNFVFWRFCWCSAYSFFWFVLICFYFAVHFICLYVFN